MNERIIILIDTLDVGGAETFIMKVFRTLNINKYTFDFLLCESKKCFYEDEVTKLGGNIYHGYYKSKHFFKSLYYIYAIAKKNNYKKALVFSQHPIVFFDLLALKFAGVSKRIVRSTNSACGGKISKFLAFVFRPIMNNLISTRIAPSKEAAQWLFGKNITKKNKYILVNNGLDLSFYKYSLLSRNKFRIENNLVEKIIIGHVGRFNKQKNHDFLIEIFKEYLSINNNSVLVLIGIGELKKNIQDKISNYNLNDNVLMFNVRSDIPKCLSSFDIFLFPSLYEGMPNIVIEAQATGLTCLISDSITEDSRITDLVNFMNLKEEPLEWAKKIDSLLMNKVNRNDYSIKISEKGYSISDSRRIIECLLEE